MKEYLILSFKFKIYITYKLNTKSNIYNFQHYLIYINKNMIILH